MNKLKEFLSNLNKPWSKISHALVGITSFISVFYASRFANSLFEAYLFLIVMYLIATMLIAYFNKIKNRED